jgi:methyl-accepting chemotaxis protein
MREINDYTSAVATALEEQNAATSEISQNVTNAAGSTGEVVAIVVEMARAVSANGTSAATVLTASKAVEAAATELRGKVETFLNKVAV